MGTEMRGRILCAKTIKLKKSSYSVYYTACSLLVILKNSCSALHRQKDFNLILLSYKIEVRDLKARVQRLSGSMKNLVYLPSNTKVYSVIYDSGSVPE